MSESKIDQKLMNFTWSGFRLLGFLSLGYGMGVIANTIVYSYYWRGTIYAVQTVDFNILSHILPYKLSALILSKNKDEIQRVIDSNYGLFGIVITDCKKDTIECPGQKILYSNKNKSTKSISDLQTQNFNYLKSPPPLFPEKKYPYTYSDNPVNTELINPGAIIGRVYYIRQKPPSFLDDYGGWLKRKIFRFSIGNSQRYYMYFGVHVSLIIAAFLSWLASELQLQHQKREEESSRKLLETKYKLLRISTFNNVFAQLIDQEFTSVAANITQKLSNALFSVMARLKVDTQNITHDVNKTPLLLASSYDLIKDLKKELSKALFSPKETDAFIEEISKLITITSDSLETLTTAIDDLRNIADLDGEPIDVNSQLLMLKERLHPSVKRWDVHFDIYPKPLIIKCNAWHFKSIIRNALYNSSFSLDNRELECLEADEPFQGKIRVFSCMIEDKANVSIVDNGCGIPDSLINELYQTDKRLNTSAGQSKGNGSMIVNAYLKLHEGEANVSNNKDSGATVQFLFPLIQSENSTHKEI